MEKDTREVKLDNYFRSQVSSYERYHKSFTCQSDRVMIDKWLAVFNASPAAEKIARNGLMLLLNGHLSDFGALKDPFTDMHNLGKNLNIVLDNYEGIPESDMIDQAAPSEQTETPSSRRIEEGYLESISEVSSGLGSSDEQPSSAITVIRNLSHRRSNHSPDSLGCRHQSNESVMQKIQSFERIAQRTQMEAALNSTKGSEHFLNFRKILAKRITSVNLPCLTAGEPRKAAINEYASLGDLQLRFEELAKRLGIDSSQNSSLTEGQSPARESPECAILGATPSLGEKIRTMAQYNEKWLRAVAKTERIPGRAKQNLPEPSQDPVEMSQRSQEWRHDDVTDKRTNAIIPSPSLGEKIRIMTQNHDTPNSECTTSKRTQGGVEQMTPIVPKSLLGKNVRYQDQKICEYRAMAPSSKDATTGCAPRGCEPIENPSTKEIWSTRREEPRSKDATTEWTPRDGERTVRPSYVEQIRSKRFMEPRFKDATTEWTPREPTEKSSPKPSQDDPKQIRNKGRKAPSSKDATTGCTPRGCEPIETARPAMDDQKVIRSTRHEEPRSKDATTEWTPRDGVMDDQKKIRNEQIRILTERNEELRRQCLVYYHEDGRLRKHPADGSQFKRMSKGFEIGVFRCMKRLRRWNGAPHSLKFFLTVFKSCGVRVGHSRLRTLDRRLEQMATRWLDEQLRIRRERVWSLYRQSVESKGESEPILTPRVAKELDQLIESRKQIIMEEMAHTAKLKELWVEYCLGKIRDQQLQQVLQKLDEKYLQLVKGLNKLARRQDKLSKHSAALGCSLINLI
ncbi:GL22537 [Drosophila persimilis]|uniref:GL22537 n=1 Tax=Drosophila persimilis TaxID=7234 RepID=B4H168_DROPE|nr:GL22537 [Drosophila persimilis]